MTTAEAGTLRPWAAASARWLLLALVLIQFFPLPKVPGVGVAPINFVILAVLLLRGGSLAGLALRGGPLTTFVFALVIFGFLDWMHDFLVGSPPQNPARHIRAAVYILLLVDVCAYPASRVQVMKWLAAVAVAEVAFGGLVYFFGGSFELVRNWMLQSADSGERIIGVGSQLAGAYGPPHIFSYLLAGFPFIVIVLFFTDRSIVWLIAIVVLFIGLFLNAERSSAAVLLLGALFMLFKTGQSARNISLLLVLAVAFFLAQRLIGSRVPDARVLTTSAYAHGTLADRFGGTDLAEVVDRVMYQVHGITSVLKHPLVGPTKAEYAKEVLGSGAILSAQDVADVIAPHNHYINIGVRGGVAGWGLLAVALAAMWRAARVARSFTRDQPALRLQFLGVTVALLGVMANALFHNGGLFTPELATSTLIGLLFALHHQAWRQAMVERALAAAQRAGPISPVAGSAARGPADAKGGGAEAPAVASRRS